MKLMAVMYFLFAVMWVLLAIHYGAMLWPLATNCTGPGFDKFNAGFVVFTFLVVAVYQALAGVKELIEK